MSVSSKKNNEQKVPNSYSNSNNLIEEDVVNFSEYPKKRLSENNIYNLKNQENEEFIFSIRNSIPSKIQHENSSSNPNKNLIQISQINNKSDETSKNICLTNGFHYTNNDDLLTNINFKRNGSNNNLPNLTEKNKTRSNNQLPYQDPNIDIENRKNSNYFYNNNLEYNSNKQFRSNKSLSNQANLLTNNVKKTDSNSDIEIFMITPDNSDFNRNNNNHSNNFNYQNKNLNKNKNENEINLNFINETNMNNRNHSLKNNSNNNLVFVKPQVKSNSLEENDKNFRKQTYSLNNLAHVRKNLIGQDPTLLNTEMKSRSNPLLQYVTIGVKSNESFKRASTFNEINFPRNSKVRTIPISKSNRNSNKELTTNSFIFSKSKSVYENGIFVLSENYKTILGLFVILGGGALIYTLYSKNSEFFEGIFENIKYYLPQDISKLLEYYFSTEFIKNNIFLVCILIAVLIALIFLIIKYFEYVKYSKLAKEDYKLIKRILQSSKNKEDNCDLIGLFENKIVKDNSEKHYLTEETYKTKVLPHMQQIRIKDDLIEEGEIIIQDQAQIVWRLKKNNFSMTL